MSNKREQDINSLELGNSKIAIEKIHIENFRSIVDLTIECGNITTFIGYNDAGKSNIIKALNLFFTRETEVGQNFDAQKDLCLFHKVGEKKAPEITIRITFKVSDSYGTGNTGQVAWQKVWRKEGPVHGKTRVKLGDGRNLFGNSRINTLLNNIQFHYIPAVKDKEFFANLQGQLYKTLASLNEGELRHSAKNFEDSIQEQIKDLLQNLDTKFNEKNVLSLPQNLRKIFEDLEFYGDDMPFNLRGDGIKVRYIPMILNFMLNKKNEYSRAIPHTHIWGFEEPENGVEMRAAYDFLDNFIDTTIRNGVQIFFTTHSPVFYGIKSKDISVKDYIVQKEENKVQQKKEFIKANSTQSKVVTNYLELNKAMGLVPIVKPYIEDEKKKYDNEIKKYKKNIEEGNAQRPTLFLEGPTDRIVMMKAIELWHGHEQLKKIIVHPSSQYSGGANYVKDQIISWHTGEKHRKEKENKAFGIFDYDAENEHTKKVYEEAVDFIKNNNHKSLVKVKKLTIPKSNAFADAGFEIPSIDLEFLYSDEIWEKADEEGWLVEKENFLIELIETKRKEMLSSLSKVNQMKLKFSWKDEGKITVAKYINHLDNDKAKEVLLEFKPLVDEIMKYLLDSE